MKANELRIGNYVYDKDKNIKPVDFDILDYFFFGMVDNSQVKPIPITEEWLERFGFKKVGINYEKGWLLLWRNKETNTIDFVVNEPHSGKRNIRHLRYVHDLQNLYFALTGEELCETL